MIENYYHNEYDFTFEDEVNLSHKIHRKKRKNYCDAFRFQLGCKITELQSLKNKIAKNYEKDPDNWKKYVIQNMEYQTILIEERNKWNKIIRKHKDNMFINGIEQNSSCCKMIEDYHELMTGSRRF